MIELKFVDSNRFELTCVVSTGERGRGEGIETQKEQPQSVMTKKMTASIENKNEHVI